MGKGGTGWDLKRRDETNGTSRDGMKCYGIEQGRMEGQSRGLDYNEGRRFPHIWKYDIGR